MTLINDWATYRNDKNAFDAYHFESLLKMHLTQPELQEIFRGLNGAEGAIERLLDLLERTRGGGFDYRLPRSENLLEPGIALTLTKTIFQGQREFLTSIGAQDLAEEIAELDVVPASIEQTKTAMNDTDNVAFGIRDEIGDNYLGQPFEPRHVFVGLYEATLALTKYQEVTRYLLDPIWPYPQKYEEDFERYLGGYIYFAANSGILLAKL